jgi:hypothetical protein
MIKHDENVKLPVTYFLEEISKATGIPADELKKMDIHDIEDKLDIRDRIDYFPDNDLYKFVTRAEYKRRTRRIEKELKEYEQQLKCGNGGS